MLPTKIKNLIKGDKKVDRNVDKSVDRDVKPMAQQSRDQFIQLAHQARKLVIQNPFWVLLISSVGIHAIFAIFTPNPVKKAEPPEVVVSTLPIVKLPPKPLTAKSPSTKSLFSNLFVNPTDQLKNSPPSNLSVPSLSLLELDPVDTNGLANLPPISNDPMNLEPQVSDSASQAPQFVQSQTRPSTPSEPSRFTDSGKLIDNNQSPKVNPDQKASNLKPEFQANNLKNDAVDADSDPKNFADQNNENRDKGKTSRVAAGEIGAETNEKEISNISALYTTDKQILDLLSQNLIKNTQIAPVDALISDPETNREKGVQWIPPKVSSISGKKGSVTLMWLVDPQGNVETRFVKSSGVKELDDIVRETAREYKFQPLEGDESGKYRLVTAKYDFQ